MSDTSNSAGGLKPGFERHIQTILGAVLLALVLWVGKTVNDNSIEITRMQEQTKSLSEKVLELRNELVSRTTSVTQVPYLNDRVNRLERRVQQLENAKRAESASRP